MEDSTDFVKNPAKTKTLSGEFWKDSDVLECIGCLDEANSFIGLARVFVKDCVVKEQLLQIQRKIFKVGTEISSGRNVLSYDDVSYLEKLIEGVEKKVKLPHEFLILESSEETAFLSVARATVRRAERRLVSLYKKNKVSLYAVEWFNKLSYLLYLYIIYLSKEFISCK